MVNAEITTLLDPDGTPVCNVAFDLSAQQLAAASHALGEVLLERHRGQVLDTDAVLALRELTGVRDELDRLAEPGAHAAMTLPLARLIVLHDAVDDWVASRAARDWLRDAEREALPVLGALLDPMAGLRAAALSAVLGAGQASR